MKRRKKQKGVAGGVRVLARQLSKILAGEKVLSGLPALETRLESLEKRIEDLAAAVVVDMRSELLRRVALLEEFARNQQNAIANAQIGIVGPSPTYGSKP